MSNRLTMDIGDKSLDNASIGTSDQQSFHDSVIQNFIDNMDVGVSVFNQDLRLVAWNKAFIKALNFPDKLSTLNTHFGDFIRYAAIRGDYGDVDVEKTVKDKVERANTPKPIEYKKTCAGRTVVRVSRIPQPQGGFIETYIDITAETRAMEAASWSETSFQTMAEIGSDWFWESDANHRFKNTNGNRRIACLPEKGVIGDCRWDTASRRDLLNDKKWHKHKALLETHKKFRDFEYETNSTPPEWVRTSGDPVFNDAGDFLGYRGVATIITERKLSELNIARKASEEEALSKLLLLSVTDSKIDEYLQNSIEELLASVSWLNLLPSGGIFLTEQESENPTLKLRAHHNFEPKLVNLCDRVVYGLCHCGKAAVTREIQFSDCVDSKHEITFDGISQHGHYNVPIMQDDVVLGVVVLYLPHGHLSEDHDKQFLKRVANVLSIGIQSRRTATALTETQELFSKAFESSPVAIAITRVEDGLIYDVNSSWLRMFGYSKKDVIGNTVFQLNLFKDPEDRNYVNQRLFAHEEVRDYEAIYLTKSGEERDVQVSAEHIEVNGEKRILGVLHDVTERKTAEKQARQLIAAFEQLTDIITIYDTDDRLIFCNKERDEIYRDKPNFTDLGISFEERIRVVAYEGIIVPAIGRQEEWIKERLAQHRNPQGAFELEISNGKTVLIREQLLPEGGTIILTSDITERKQLELQARRSQKMDAVGQLTGGVAHDFNNILGIVMGNLEFLEEILADNTVASKFVENAISGITRGANITRKLLSFSRKEAEEISLTSANEFVQNLTDLIAKSLTASIDVETHLEKDLWLTKIDTGELEDALLNLAINARDAMPDGGKLVIETANKTLDEEHMFDTSSSQTREYVMISVSDNGCGMSSDIKDKVLEPFFTTKELGHGTGLGLSMVYGFVNRSGGQIEIYSEPGKGTVFNLYLPRASEKEISQEPSTNIKNNLQGGCETILVVDDEEALREVAVIRLEALGYKILSAENGDKALDVIKENEHVDLLFTDIVMPGSLDGYQLSMEALKLRPDIKILATSGFTKRQDFITDVSGKEVTKLKNNLLSKPYNKSELASTVRKILDSA